MQILIGGGLPRVNHDERGVAAVNRRRGAHHAELLDPGPHRAAPPDARGVYQQCGRALERERRVERVPRRACNLAHDGALLAQHGVGERGFPHVGAPDDGDARRLGREVAGGAAERNAGDERVH